jgi:hypothetical protein
MLQHRLISTQRAAGLSLRNVGAFVGGQLAYVTPPFLFGAGLLLWDLAKRRGEDAVSSLLFWSSALVALPLSVLCLWSRVAEPHWFAPAYLALAVHLGRAERVGRRLARVSVALGVLIVALAWTWIRTPLAPRLLGDAYRARYDLANDLFAWEPGGALVEVTLRELRQAQPGPFVVVGPHWIVCAQLHAHLGRRVAVGCNGPRRDDFDAWLPRERWASAPHVLYVHDSRFELSPEKELPHRTARLQRAVEIVRGGRVVRTIWVTHLELTAAAARAPGPQPGAAASPAARMSSASSSGPGFGVVRSFSP